MNFLHRLFGGGEKKPQREAEQPSPPVPVTEVEAEPVPLTPEEQAKALVAQLRFKDIGRSAARELTHMGAQAVEPLIAALQHRDLDVRRAAARILGRIGDPRAVEPLVDIALGMDPKPLRADADKALLAIGEPALAPIIEGLDRPGVNALPEAADLLGRMGDPRAVDPLAAALHAAPGYRKASVVKALGRIGDGPAVEALAKAMQYQDVRPAAARWLERFEEEAVAPLIAVLGNEDAGSAAARVLTKIGAPAVEPLIAALEDPDPAVRRAAVGALHELTADANLDQSLREAASSAADQVDIPALDAELSKRPAKPKPKRKRAPAPKPSPGRGDTLVVVMSENDERATYRLTETCLGNPLNIEVTTEKYCVYCKHLRDPNLRNPGYPKGVGECSNYGSSKSVVSFDDTCEYWQPNTKVRFWLSKGYMAHNLEGWPRRPWYQVFDDGPDGERGTR